MSSPYHEGEQALQARLGVRDAVERAGRRGIRDFMPEQHRRFFAAQPLLFAGSLDARGRLWASVLAGPPGFISSPDPRTLSVAARPVAPDPLASNLAVGASLGLLGIEFESRRRNRVNGAVSRVDAHGFDVRVEQSFGNCPQYIQARKWSFRAEPPAAAAAPVQREPAQISQRAAALIGRADTFFIATASSGAGDAAKGADVSHRGGKPGFVRVELEAGRSVLTCPDFIGNFFFNTFGNLQLNPRAGLLFVDFGSGDTLSLTGEAQVIWEGPELDAFAGAERLFRFRVDEGLWLDNACPLRWTPPEQAPQLEATGSWRDVASLLGP